MGLLLAGRLGQRKGKPISIRWSHGRAGQGNLRGFGCTAHFSWGAHLLSSGAVQGSREPGGNWKGRVRLRTQKPSVGGDLRPKCSQPPRTM